MKPDVVLVTMPWAAPWLPSIQLGTVKALLVRAGHTVATRYYNMRFAEYAIAATAELSPEDRVTLEDCYEIGDSSRIGDWVFAVPPFRPVDDQADAALLRLGRVSRSGEFISKLRRMHALAPGFLEHCAEDIVSAAPRVLGFTTTFNQNIASLALAKLVKQRAPDIAIVFGGANCDGPMGAAIHRLFDWVDIVVRGEAERVVGPVVEDLLANRPVRELPGVCVRRDGVSHPTPFEHELVAMSEVPTPDYDEYFELLSASQLREDLMSKVRITYESARGCWWGEKNHCTFCGLNGSAMTFRSKSADRAYEEMVALSRRHQSVHFQVVDNIIDLRYLSDLLPRLRATGWAWEVFYETKANLKRDQLRLFRESGVRSIQPGIESLSSPILKLMKKGVTALQNIRLLKWCAELGVRVNWNMLYGFPREDPAEYAAMVELIPSLVHLDAPLVGRLALERFSPYHNDPEKYGIQNLGAAPEYRLLYPVPAEELDDLAYAFEFRYQDGREPDDYAQPLIDAIDRWRNSEDAGALVYERGPGFITIEDHRMSVEAAHYTFDEQEALIYLACDAGAKPAQVQAVLASRGYDQFSKEEIAAFLDNLVDLRLVFREGDRYLSLATERDPHRALIRESLQDVAEHDEPHESSTLVRVRRRTG